VRAVNLPTDGHPGPLIGVQVRAGPGRSDLALRQLTSAWGRPLGVDGEGGATAVMGNCECDDIWDTAAKSHLCAQNPAAAGRSFHP
jgi:hypothetical protein